jgi:hypothetical protein
MFSDKDIYHDEICEMAAEQEEAEMLDFYAGPEPEPRPPEIEYLERIAISYPHDITWAQAIASLAGLNEVRS